MKKKICCIFNMAPLYRESIYKKIDEEFDAQFCFGEAQEGIIPMEFSKFTKKPLLNNVRNFAKVSWRKGIQLLPYKNYESFLVIGDFNISYIPFLLSCKLLKKPVFAWGHGLKNWGGLTSYTSKLIMSLLTGFITYGEGGKQRFIELGVPAYKLHVIYNSLGEGVDIEHVGSCQSDIIKNHFVNDYPTIVFVGRLTKVKKLDWLIKAISLHKERNIKYNLLIIGDGTEMERLRALADNSIAKENIWFFGECYDEKQLNSLLYNSDLCVSPGNVGLTALHAMMYGTPVLSHSNFETQMPEYETIDEGKTGTLYENGNFDDFCAKIEKWICSNVDREQIRLNCYNMINGRWNSNYQISLLKKIINK